MSSRKTFLEFLKSRSKKYNINESFVSGSGGSVGDVGAITSLIKQPYALVGGIALNYHGYERHTSDVDILVDPSNLHKVADSLDHVKVSNLTIGGVALTLRDGSEVDLISKNDKWVDDAIHNSLTTPIGKVIQAPYLVLMKLESSRGGKEDVDMLMLLKKMSKSELDFTRKLVKQYLPNDVDDLQSMIDMAPYI